MTALKETARSVEKTGGSCRIISIDLLKIDELQNVVKGILSEYGKIDLLVNAAGLWHEQGNVLFGKRFIDIDVEEVNRVMTVNLSAPMLLSKLVGKAMARKRKGAIINISGTFNGAGNSRGGALWLHYFTAKQALEKFSIALADEMREFGIGVFCVSPSETKTPGLKQFFKEDFSSAIDPSEIAKVVSSLALPSAKFTSGNVIEVRNAA
jgi:3-oxoacyl-[acyl-carrier protein] reductase